MPTEGTRARAGVHPGPLLGAPLIYRAGGQEPHLRATLVAASELANDCGRGDLQHVCGGRGRGFGCGRD